MSKAKTLNTGTALMSKADAIAIEAYLTAIVRDANRLGAERIAIKYSSAAYVAMGRKLERLSKRKIPSVMDELLASSFFCKDHGMWLIAGVESEEFMLVKVNPTTEVYDPSSGIVSAASDVFDCVSPRPASEEFEEEEGEESLDPPVAAGLKKIKKATAQPIVEDKTESDQEPN